MDGLARNIDEISGVTRYRFFKNGLMKAIVRKAAPMLFMNSSG